MTCSVLKEMEDQMTTGSGHNRVDLGVGKIYPHKTCPFLLFCLKLIMEQKYLNTTTDSQNISRFEKKPKRTFGK